MKLGTVSIACNSLIALYCNVDSKKSLKRLQKNPIYVNYFIIDLITFAGWKYFKTKSLISIRLILDAKKNAQSLFLPLPQFHENFSHTFYEKIESTFQFCYQSLSIYKRGNLMCQRRRKTSTTSIKFSVSDNENCFYVQRERTQNFNFLTT